LTSSLEGSAMNDIITRRLYGGRVTVDLNPKVHRYHVSDTKAAPDGVTTLCNGTIPKFNLIDWAGRTCAQAVRDGCLKVLEETGMFPEQTAFLAICQEAEKAHNVVRDAAGDSGSTTHDLIEKHLKGEPYRVPDDVNVEAGYKAFLMWLEQTDVEIIEIERLVYSEKYFYCGKADILGRRNGKLLIGDFKTGNSAGYESEWYQLAAYALAIEEETGDKIEEGLIVHLDKKTGRYKEYHVTIDDDMKGAWKAAVIHYKNLKRVRKLVEAKRNGT
jgi:CRISPR/Cas system-associated exonuclease Cas4 (RecB family)